MRFINNVIFASLTVVALALAGCGGSSSTSADPFSTSGNNGTDPHASTIFGNISTSTGKTGISLRTDRASIDGNNGQLLAMAQVLEGGAPLPNVKVTFNVIAGPATFQDVEARTDSTGVAYARITAGDADYTTNVIISASASVGSYLAVARTSFQVIRGGGVIMFTSNAGAPSGSQNNILLDMEAEVDPAVSTEWAMLRLIPFKVTDSNGNPRVGVPVTLSVFSITTLDPDDIIIDFVLSATEEDQQTIITDSAGEGIFNTVAILKTPPAGATNAINVVFKAETNDTIPVTAYVGAGYTLTGKKPDEPVKQP